MTSLFLSKQKKSTYQMNSKILRPSNISLILANDKRMFIISYHRPIFLCVVYLPDIVMRNFNMSKERMHSGAAFNVHTTSQKTAYTRNAHRIHYCGAFSGSNEPITKCVGILSTYHIRY